MTNSATQFSVFMVSKPGVMAGVCQALAAAKINVIAMTMVDSNDHGVMRFVAADPVKVRAALKKIDLPTAETDVLLAELPNKPGSMADCCERLGSANIAINYAYCTGKSPNGKSLAVFKVSDVKKALKTLDTRAPRRQKTGATVYPRGRRA